MTFADSPSCGVSRGGTKQQAAAHVYGGLRNVQKTNGKVVRLETSRLSTVWLQHEVSTGRRRKHRNICPIDQLSVGI